MFVTRFPYRAWTELTSSTSTSYDPYIPFAAFDPGFTTSTTTQNSLLTQTILRFFLGSSLVSCAGTQVQEDATCVNTPDSHARALKSTVILHM
jgi:hypothetical protein